MGPHLQVFGRFEAGSGGETGASCCSVAAPQIVLGKFLWTALEDRLEAGFGLSTQNATGLPTGNSPGTGTRENSLVTAHAGQNVVTPLRLG